MIRGIRLGNWDWIPGYFKGEDVFLVGSGPSLKGFDFDRLKGKRNIVISHVMEFVRPEILVSLDDNTLDTNGKGLLPMLWKHYGVKDFYQAPFRSVFGNGMPYTAGGVVTVVKVANDVHMDPSKGFFGPMSTGHFAINLALACGAGKIYLLGFDCCVINGDQNFYNTQDVKGWTPGDAVNRYERMVQGFDKYRKIGKEGRIVNLSEISVLTSFPKLPVDDVL